MKIILYKRSAVLTVLILMGAALIFVGVNGIGKINPEPAAPAATTIIKTDQPGSQVNSTNERQIVDNSKPKSKNKDGFFIEYRLERERTRGQQVEWLREIINNPNAEAETRKKAQEELYTITRNIGKEMEIESLIRAKGFKDAVVLLQDKVATVVVQAEALTTERAAKIAELVSRNTGIPMPNIVIIPKP